MTRLAWHKVGENTFEAGVEKGVLYVDGADGVPWNGLISVAESPSGGDATPFYIDGIKYLNYVSSEEFEATIQAYTYPDEFGVCDGTAPVKVGLYATQQKRKPFGLSYQTNIGNDVEGINYGYKIHLVYNASASPTSKQNSTMSDNVEPFNFSWKLVTTPPMVAGVKPTAHFVIDSREVSSDLMSRITDILYGSDTTAARLPSLVELVSIFTQYETSTYDEKEITNPEPFFSLFDAGTPSDPETSSIDGGMP